MRKKSPIHENTNAKIYCDFGDERFRIAAARLEKDIFVRTHLHTARIVVRISLRHIQLKLKTTVKLPHVTRYCSIPDMMKIGIIPF